MVINVSITPYHPFYIGASVNSVACPQLLSGFIFPTDAL